MSPRASSTRLNSWCREALTLAAASLTIAAQQSAMFRRIELIEHMSRREQIRFLRRLAGVSNIPVQILDQITSRDWKHGLMGLTRHGTVIRAWVEMPSPRRLFKNTKFYFTEEGWRRYGRKTVAACLTVGQRYRVIRIKEKSVDVVYRDDVQVAVRPRKARQARSGRKGEKR